MLRRIDRFIWISWYVAINLQFSTVGKLHGILFVAVVRSDGIIVDTHLRSFFGTFRAVFSVDLNFEIDCRVWLVAHVVGNDALCVHVYVLHVRHARFCKRISRGTFYWRCICFSYKIKTIFITFQPLKNEWKNLFNFEIHNTIIFLGFKHSIWKCFDFYYFRVLQNLCEFRIIINLFRKLIS